MAEYILKLYTIPGNILHAKLILLKVSAINKEDILQIEFFMFNWEIVVHFYQLAKKCPAVLFT